MTTNVVGSAFISILPDTSKTAALTVSGLGAAGTAGGKALSTGIAAGANAGAEAAGGAFSKFGQTAKNALGGALGPIADVQAHFEGLAESVKSHGVMSAQSLTAIGTAALGAGTALMAIGSADKQANAQLQASIKATGQDYDDYKDKIETVIKQQEKFGTSAANTQRALQTLVNITGDTSKATNLMGLAANLAAARHTSLTSAATAVGKAAEGNTRLFKLYGIQVQTNADGTKNIQGAMDELSKKLDGQASASVSGFTGHLKVLGTQVEDNVAKFGQKWGPTITAVGAGLGLLGGVVQLAGKGIDAMRGSTEAATEATNADVAASRLSAAATTEEATASSLAEGAETALAGAEGEAALGAAGQAKAAGAASAANIELATTSEAATSGGLLKMAAGAGIAGVAILGVGLIVNHFMSESKKQAAEGTAAFNTFWASVTANRSQTSLVDINAELGDLKKQMTDRAGSTAAAEAFLKFGGTTNAAGKELDLMVKKYHELTATQTTVTANTKAMADEFHLTTDQVAQLATANGIDLTGALNTVEAAFMKVQGGTGDQVAQMQALEKQYGLTAAQVDAFAKSQSLTLKGTADQTTAFQAAVTAQQNTGSSVQILRDDYEKLGSSVSSATEKESAFKSVLDELLGKNISAAQMIDDYQLKINDLGSALDTGTHSLDQYSDGGIKNRKVIEGLIQDAIAAADATYKQTGSVDAASATYADYYNKAISAANANGITQDSLTTLITSIGGLPQQVAAGLGATVGVAGAAGSSAVTAFADTLGSTYSTGQIIKSTAIISSATSSGLSGMSAIGQNAADSLAGGYIAGITSNLSNINRITSQVPAAARSALNISSPSKVMHTIGQQTAAGLALGIASGAGAVKAAATALAKSAVPTPGSVMPTGGGVQVNGFWYTPAQLAAAGGIDAAIAAHPATGGAATPSSSSPLTAASGGMLGSSSTVTLDDILKVLQGIADKQAGDILNTLTAIDGGIAAEVAATNAVGKAVTAAAGAELSALAQEVAAGVKGKTK